MIQEHEIFFFIIINYKSNILKSMIDVYEPRALTPLETYTTH